MPAWRQLLPAVFAALVCSGAGAAGLDVLEACLAAGPAQTRGLAALQAECPGLEQALLDAGFTPALAAGWRKELDRDALASLMSLSDRYQQVPAQAALDAGALPAILSQLATEQEPQSTSWWQQFVDRLRSWLSSEQAEPTPWLERLLQRLAQSVNLIEIITYALLALIVVAAVGLVVNELRVAGVLRRRRPSGARAVVRDSAAPILPAGDVDLDSVATRDQPAMLLRQLVARLLQTGQLKAERSLTHRELIDQSSLADPQGQQSFNAVARLAERVLYGAGDANGVEVGRVLADGRTLLQQLQQQGTQGNA